jgi:hypothetical protein
MHEMMNAVNQSKQSNVSRRKFALREAQRWKRDLWVVRYW